MRGLLLPMMALALIGAGAPPKQPMDPKERT